jgi:hypothetical protein
MLGLTGNGDHDPDNVEFSQLVSKDKRRYRDCRNLLEDPGDGQGDDSRSLDDTTMSTPNHSLRDRLTSTR